MPRTENRYCVSVDDVVAGIRFWSAALGHAPTEQSADSATWVIDSPPLVFRIRRYCLDLPLLML